MTIRIEKPGLQTTVQAAPFFGHRHVGMPAAGAADCLSSCLANRLVGKIPTAATLEVTLDAMEFTVRETCTIAVTGAAEYVKVNDEAATLHKSFRLTAGNKVRIGPARTGCRSYVAFAGDPSWNPVLGSWSTCLQAGLGGYQGRGLRAGDILEFSANNFPSDALETPVQFIPNLSGHHLLRVTAGPEFTKLEEDSRHRLFSNKWQSGQRSSRMGTMLAGTPLDLQDHNTMPSAAVFPGTIQCPPDGAPFLLGPDAQTTGGYPRVAQVIRADRHLIGQLRPGDRVQLVLTSPEKAQEIYRQKLKLLQPWLGDISLW
ncbi:allophanate hydrolase [Parasphingorhabdus marina DSM 22363]|uniref:Allophanate hydrolase n=1 Tax=Parasphingorhabdus marina DSM 22363 TaxID=1123272 RepID=A0A1N6GEC7_9SPHN|nr:biotin-dependent carboxyltransferase family protein [Parasphingorhabdus marina]SIO05861.1 allophanate hydrolase [Parasphingorhabdus marina DSM 22363]